MSVKETALLSPSLIEIPDVEWRGLMQDDGSSCGDMEPVRIELWLSRKFHVQLFDDGGYLRMTVGRVKRVLGSWRDGITWDELMQVKREVGRGNRCGIELFPPDEHVVNVANLRHLWLVEPPPFMWGKR